MRRARTTTPSSAASSSRSPTGWRAAAEPAVLGQVVLKLTCPGVPDIYQGDELAFRALVDPDNRRPVDFGWRQAMLRRLMGGSPPDAETRKLFIILRLLGLRGRRPELFGAGPAGAYRPLEAGESVCAFTRGDGLLVAVATRPSALASDVAVATPPGRWRRRAPRRGARPGREHTGVAAAQPPRNRGVRADVGLGLGAAAPATAPRRVRHSMANERAGCHRVAPASPGRAGRPGPGGDRRAAAGDLRPRRAVPR